MIDSDLLFAVDSLVERDGLLFGWGWVLAPGDAVRDVWIAVDDEAGEARLECAVTGVRTDASRAGTDAFGFVIAGKLPKNYMSGSAVLHVNRETTGLASRTLPGFPQDFLGPPGLAKRLKHRLNELRRALQASGLVGLGRHIYGGASAPGWAGQKKSPDELPTADQRPVELVIDHSMGGGANKFADELIASRLYEDVDVVILRPVLASLVYSVERRRGQGSHMRQFSELAEALAYLSIGKYAKVHCNHLVSYESVRQVFDFCERQAVEDCEVVFYVHDYFSICPSWALMDDRGAFCNIPQTDVCARCLPVNPALFASYFKSQGIEAWRQEWHGFLLLCSSIVVFSESTRRLVLRVYPDLENKILLQPHRIVPPDVQAPVWRSEQRWVIGIFGHISRHKGADVLVEIADLAEQRGLPMDFFVFGSLSAKPRSTQLKVVGPYESKEMASIANQYNLLATFVPSICSETFSYVTAELMHLRLPVAVFDRGAPADRVRNYELGLVIESLDPAAALTDLEMFCRQQAVERGSAGSAIKYRRKLQ